MSNSSPIGLFDSGFGGLTVMRELTKVLPHENIIYLADTLNMPYGNKPAEMIQQYALENGSFLLSKGIKLLVIPCHTACAHALKLLQKQLPIPVLGVIQPALEILDFSKRIAVIGTTSTIESNTYQSHILEKNPQTVLYTKSCPLFAPLVEEGLFNRPIALQIAKSYLKGLQGKIDTALLACTHYPLMRSTIKKALGSEVSLIEPTNKCCKDISEHLLRANLLNLQKAPPCYKFYTTDHPEKFQLYGKIFFGQPIENVEKK